MKRLAFLSCFLVGCCGPQTYPSAPPYLPGPSQPGVILPPPPPARIQPQPAQTLPPPQAMSRYDT